MPVTYGSVCSGIESASVAWGPLGMVPAWFAEIEKFPSAVLAHRWPGVPNLGDMTKIADFVKCAMVPAPDILVGGTPCQPFSVAGSRKSLDDARGSLTIEYVRLLNEIDNARKKPAACVWENVPGVLNTKDNAFGAFLGELAGSGHQLQPPNGRKWGDAGIINGPRRAVAWRVLNAEFFGVAQRRRRVFVVASARGGFDPGQVLFEFDSVCGGAEPCEETRQETAGGFGGGSHWTGARVHPTLSQSHNTGGIGMSNQELFGQKGAGLVGVYTPSSFGQYRIGCGTLRASGGDAGMGSENIVVHGAKPVRKLTPVEYERLQGFPDNHTRVPWRGKPAEDCPDGPRYKAVGNSKAVPVVRWVGQRILDHLSALGDTRHITDVEKIK